ncbi:DNA internalization-related competence protein ComEC/Rec2 [Vibrio inusitatus NBRC 102082]|uniref:DNA internalization-related competence protein ComEC/Rec2 n=2 Tax=Vibrio inusitatus TaxID=413402 RepID=A0A4Y3HRX3_9VIBR|nr:DNA internalization-related competence protein ComEC/Rec2 [Vibrio inusitatus NBRC 102082]
MAQQMTLGEVWQVSVKIQPIVGLFNEAGFDAERFYFGQNVIAEAKVNKVLHRVDEANLRGRWYSAVHEQTESLISQPIMLALLFGERSLINPQQWSGLKQTGLAHLIAISGLHIGLAYMLGWWIGHSIRIVVPRWIWAPIIVAVALALFYAWLAGFSLPTQRALIMCLITSIALLIGIRLSRWRILWLTLALVLVFSPMSAVSASLWLSVGAVIIIFLALAKKNLENEEQGITIQGSQLRWPMWLRIQVYLSLGLAPISAWVLGGVAWLSIAFNTIAIPMISMFVVPALLAGIMIHPLSESMSYALFHLADIGLRLLLRLISEAQHYPDLWFQASVGQILGMVGIFCLVCLRNYWRIVTLCISAGLSLFLCLSNDNTKWRIDVMDVGHGLAVLVESNNRVVLYDTGANWGEGSIAQMVIEPLIVRRGASLDALFISHWDNDHQGGMDYLVSRFLPKHVFTPQQNGKTLPCMQGQFWWWQGLKFEIIWPPRRVYRAYNPHSCVIRISDDQYSVLLTGDIDALAEYQMTGAIRKSDVIIVPHHGSNTSSTGPLVDKVNAKVAIASVANKGRWLLPSQDVVKRYRESGAQWLDTGSNGQVSVHFLSDEVKVMTLRNPQTAAWYRQILRKGVE